MIDPAPPVSPEGAYERALDLLRAHGPWGVDVDSTQVLLDLGLTAADVLALTAARTMADRLQGLQGDERALIAYARVLVETEFQFQARQALSDLTSWLDATERGIAYSWLVPDPDEVTGPDGSTTQTYPGLRAPAAVWWSIAFDHEGMNGDKPHAESSEWYAAAPEAGPWAYAAGLTLDEVRIRDLDLDDVRALSALRASAAPETSSSARAAARLGCAERASNRLRALHAGSS